MKYFFLSCAAFLISVLTLNAQGTIPTDIAENIPTKPNRIKTLYLSFGYENLFDREFSNNIGSLGKSPLPQSFFLNGSGVMVQNDKWTLLRGEATSGRRRDLGDNPEVSENFSYFIFKLGTGYNVLKPTNQFRLEPGISFLIGVGSYRLNSEVAGSSFDEAISRAEFNSLHVRQSNFGLNLNLSIGPNPFLENGKEISQHISSLEVGTNLMLWEGRMNPAFANSPGMDVSSFYIRMAVNMITW